MMERLHKAFPNIEKDFQIIPSRVRDLDPERKRIYYVHDLPGDGEVQHLKDGGWNKFDIIVFVSHWQQQMYNAYLGVPYEAGTVIRNAIKPIYGPYKRDSDTVNLIYFGTPHRGLDVLMDAYKRISKDYEDKIHLNVYSSFALYGWKERDTHFQALFDDIKNHEHASYFGSVSNEEIRKILPTQDIFAYPSTWLETSCLCLIESMSAKLDCVHSSLGALPETSGGLTNMYGFVEDKEWHSHIFEENLRDVIDNNIYQKEKKVKRDPNQDDYCDDPKMTKTYIDMLHNYDLYVEEWGKVFDELSY